MAGTRNAHQAVVTRVLEGDGRATRAERHAAFNNATLTQPLHGLISKVARQPAQITNGEIAAVKAAGLSEDEIFELVICAAVGQATRQYQSALAALAAAISEEGS
jgi:alkylhydroperoxidase/carboxymuconolactone decarboxylase family protein YurZ